MPETLLVLDDRSVHADVHIILSQYIDRFARRTGTPFERDRLSSLPRSIIILSERTALVRVEQVAGLNTGAQLISNT
jgi:hypothetical protein